MARVADRVMDALVAEVKGRTEWDEFPAPYFMYRLVMALLGVELAARPTR